MSMVRHRGYDLTKRVLDVAAAGVGLLVASPLLVVLALIVAANLGRPVLFKQDRPGKDACVFRLYKFRTMKSPDESQRLITDAQRLTKFGRVLRSSSLDELPTLWNVLKGDMSLVGPRPLLVQYLDRYSSSQARRHEVRPGVTGLAQISGRNAISWDEKFALDVEYVDSRSLALDARILATTFARVFRRSGISADGHATAPEFMGTNTQKRQVAPGVPDAGIVRGNSTAPTIKERK